MKKEEIKIIFYINGMGALLMLLSYISFQYKIFEITSTFSASFVLYVGSFIFFSFGNSVILFIKFDEWKEKHKNIVIR